MTDILATAILFTRLESMDITEELNIFDNAFLISNAAKEIEALEKSEKAAIALLKTTIGKPCPVCNCGPYRHEKDCPLAKILEAK